MARLAAYAAVVVAGTWGLTSVQSAQDRLDGVVQAQAAADRLDAAERCVASWETREDIRDAAEKAGRAGGEASANAGADALVDVVEADPAQVEQYRQALAHRLDEHLQPALDAARAEIPDPTCDRAAAQRVIDHQEDP